MSTLTKSVKKWSSFLRSLFIIILLVIASVAFIAFWRPADAQAPSVLASTYAPVLHFTSGEKFYPTSVEYIIGSSILRRRLSDGTSDLVDPSPTPYNLGTYSFPDMYLDNKLGTFENIAADYAAKAGTIGYYAYVRVANVGSWKVIQYWLFYIFNNGPLNDHQGDIEVVQIFLDASGNPQKALYSQHSAGENAGWGDVEKSDTHPIVYVAQGSHANYFRSYQGKMGIENDIVAADGLTVNPSDLNLVMLESQSWLNFPGRWGCLGSLEEVALGRAGPLGPVFNQEGIRWAQPLEYLDSTFGVNGTYFILAWLVANFLLLFLLYALIRGAWKGYGIAKLRKKGGLLVKKFLRGRGGIGLGLGVASILLSVIALFFPWYTIVASSETGPLARQGGVTLMTIDGIGGVKVNMFFGPGGDSPSGYRNLFSMQTPFAVVIGVGLILLALDIIGVKSGKSIGTKFMLGAIGTVLPLIIILIFIVELPAFLPWASSLVPGQSMPYQVEDMVRTVAGNPVYGSGSQSFPVVGLTTATWGLGIGAYMLIVAAVIRIVAGFVMRTAPELQAPTTIVVQPEMQSPSPPPPPPLTTQ